MKWLNDLNSLNTLQVGLTWGIILLSVLLAFTQQKISKLQGAQGAAQEQKVQGLQDYNGVARLNAIGIEVDGPVAAGLFSSGIKRALAGTFKFNNPAKTIDFEFTPEAEAKYKTVIDREPRFPFTYVLYAECLRERKDPAWRGYAEKAVEIFKITTKIGGHNGQHDIFLQRTEEMLRINPRE